MPILARRPENPAAVTAFVEIVITAGMLTGGFLTDRALRQIRHDCRGVDTGGEVIVHLGSLRHPDEDLLHLLAELGCPVSFGGNWRVAAAAREMLTALRSAVA
jgi:hypothetical protein